MLIEAYWVFISPLGSAQMTTLCSVGADYGRRDLQSSPM